MSTHRQRPVWQEAMHLAVRACRLAETCSETGATRLAAQLTRAAVHVPTLIAQSFPYGSGPLSVDSLQRAESALLELETLLVLGVRLGRTPQAEAAAILANLDGVRAELQDELARATGAATPAALRADAPLDPELDDPLAATTLPPPPPDDFLVLAATPASQPVPGVHGRTAGPGLIPPAAPAPPAIPAPGPLPLLEHRVTSPVPEPPVTPDAPGASSAAGSAAAPDSAASAPAPPLPAPAPAPVRGTPLPPMRTPNPGSPRRAGSSPPRSGRHADPVPLLNDSAPASPPGLLAVPPSPRGVAAPPPRPSPLATTAAGEATRIPPPAPPFPTTNEVPAASAAAPAAKIVSRCAPPAGPPPSSQAPGAASPPTPTLLTPTPADRSASAEGHPEASAISLAGTLPLQPAPEPPAGSDAASVPAPAGHSPDVRAGRVSHTPGSAAAPPGSRPEARVSTAGGPAHPAPAPPPRERGLPPRPSDAPPSPPPGAARNLPPARQPAISAVRPVVPRPQPRPAAPPVDRLLVDGSNFLGCAPGYMLEDEESRERLFRRLQDYARRHPAHRVIAFHDGKKASHRTVGSVEERFTSGQRTADDVMLDFLGSLPPADQRRCTFVTNDQELGRRARAYGARVEGVEWLHAQFNSSGPTVPGARPEQRPSRSEMADWEDFFNKPPQRPGHR